MRISVDAMGGDYAPQEIVAGTLKAAQELKGIEKLYLVGDEAAIKAELAKHNGPTPSCIEIVHASEVIGMGESPGLALRRKKDSSIMRSVDLVKEGKADAVYSAGSTGAAVGAGLLRLRTLQLVDRPAIATVMPSVKGPFVLLDAGATPDCTPQMLAEFGVMGSIYAEHILGISNPRVGLMSIGEEDSKGSKASKEAFQILDKTNLNFIGNVESHDMFEGAVDVVVCDGFVGNVVLKTSEGAAHAMVAWLKDVFVSSTVRKIGAGILKASGAITDLKKKIDPEVYGGAPLLGVNGVVIIGHGSSSSVAVYNGIRVASEAIDHDVNHLIEDQLKSINTTT